VAAGAEQPDVRLRVAEVLRSIVREADVDPMHLEGCRLELSPTLLTASIRALEQLLLQRRLLDDVALRAIDRPASELPPAPPVFVVVALRPALDEVVHLLLEAATLRVELVTSRHAPSKPN
jgi:hypothetical protein